MKTKKIMYRVASTAMCLTLLGAGAQVFAATSDSYTGFSVNGDLAAAITCKINANDGFLFYDSCTASTQSAPDTLQVSVLVGMANANGDIIAEGELMTGMGKVSDTLFSYDRTSAVTASSLHMMTDDVYGLFLYQLNATYEN